MKIFGAILSSLFMIEYVIASNHVPALIWSNKPDNVQKNLQYSSQVSDITGQDLLANFVDRNIPVVALVQNSLSVEQFSANTSPFISSIFQNKESQPVFYSNIRNVPNSLSTFSEDESKIGTKNVVINLNGKTLKENDELLRSYFEKYNNTGAVFIYTGKKNEFDMGRLKRQAPAAKEGTENLFGGKDKDGKHCFFLHFFNGSVTYQTAAGEIKTEEFENKNTIGNTKCQVADVKDSTGKSIKYYFVESFDMGLNTKQGKAVNLKFGVSNAIGNWKLNSINATIDGKDYIGKAHLSTPGGFCRSCQSEQFTVTREDSSDKGKKFIRATISFRRFQFQPFVAGEVTDASKFRFTDSSDCAVWLTLPLFSGLIVVLLLLTILYSGVRALMSIMTPDRFENPKGKGLIITNFEE